MVLVHQHKILKKTSSVAYHISKNQQKPATTVEEKCYMCDAMHHNEMTIAHYVYYSPIIVRGHVYKTGDYSFTSLSLVLAAGRAPPVFTASC
jgi:hypothetical protein